MLHWSSNRKVVIFNLDPANDKLPYEPDIDISDLVMVKSVMKEFDLGPNGGIVSHVINSSQILSRLDHGFHKYRQFSHLVCCACDGSVSSE